jgi:hypothetical protein
VTARLFHLITEFDTGGARKLGAANNPNAGVVVAAVPPDMRRGFELGWELLGALGKRDDVAGPGRNHDKNWDLVTAWMLAHPVSNLVLLDAQWLNPELVGDVAALAAVCDLTVWFVAHIPIDDKYAASIDVWPVRTGDPKALAAALRTPAPQHCATSGFPTVPLDNWATWLAEVRQRLDGEAAAMVEQRYRSAFRSASRFLESTAAVEEATVLGHLRAELAACTTAHEMITVIRAVQAAAFAVGWLVHADLPRLLATAEHAARAAVNNPANFTSLIAYREPYRAVACALAALDLSTDQMRAITIADAAVDGATVSVDGATRAMPAGTALYLRAQLALRDLEGGRATDALIGGSDGAFRDRHLVNAVRSAIGDLGVPFISQTLSRTPVDSNRWANRWGLAVQGL